jgi:hypothetical protein
MGNSHRRRFRRGRGGGISGTKPMGDALRHACRSPRRVGIHPRTGYWCALLFRFLLSDRASPNIAFGLLVMETHNDFIRFHGAPVSSWSCVLCHLTWLLVAYQSALLTTPLILLRIFASLLQLFSILRTFLTLLLLSSICFMSYVPSICSRNGADGAVLGSGPTLMLPATDYLDFMYHSSGSLPSAGWMKSSRRL